MKGYLITATLEDGRKEGVLFNYQHDALCALYGVDEGNPLVVAFSKLHADEELELVIIEI